MTALNQRELNATQGKEGHSEISVKFGAAPHESVLVSIFQRGAADGLNSVVPYGDKDYRVHRPGIRIPGPNEVNGALDLDGFFGLNPNLAAMHSLYQQGNLAIVHACGIPHGSRSHFKAQTLVEQASQGQLDLTGGWLGRHYQIAHGLTPPQSAYCVVAISGSLPVALTGTPAPMALANIADFFADDRLLTSGYEDIMQSLFSHQGVPMGGVANVAIDAFNELAGAALQLTGPSNGAVYPDSQLGGSLRQAAQLIKSDLPVETIVLDSPGWDHHENIAYYLPRSLLDLDQSVSAFLQDLGALTENVTVLVHTEFGRRVRENASLGVDHGTGGVVYVMGAKVNGGQMYGQWPTLGYNALDQGEDLRITTDLRSIYAEILSKRLGATDLDSILPGFAGPTDLGILA